MEDSSENLGVRPFVEEQYKEKTKKIQKKIERMSSVDRMIQDLMLNTVYMLVSREKYIIKLATYIFSEKVGPFPLSPFTGWPDQILDKYSSRKQSEQLEQSKVLSYTSR